MLMIVLDVTVVNVALPSIKDDLGFSQSSLAWVVNGYLITFGGLLLLAGRLGDLLGRRRIFLIGLALFVAASLLCGASQSEGMLIGARLLQGVGGAMTSTVILGMIVTMFRGQRERPRRSASRVRRLRRQRVGLLLGGVVTQSSLALDLLVVAPIDLVTAAPRGACSRTTRVSTSARARPARRLLITTSLMLGVYTIVKPAAEQGWAAPDAAARRDSLALLALFIAREATAARRLIPLRIFRSRNVSGANTVQVLTVAGSTGCLHGLPLPPAGAGYDTLQIGLAFLR